MFMEMAATRRRILLVEDSPEIQAVVCRGLEGDFQLSVVGSLAEARFVLEERGADLVILDIGLPDGLGYDLCKTLRGAPETNAIPIIFLTDRGTIEDKVKGFSLEADDYVVKPFDTLELRHRAHAVLRRWNESREEADNDYYTGSLRFDRIKQLAWVRENSLYRNLNLTPFEFKLLYFLASHEPNLYERGQLMRCITDDGLHVREDTLYTHISAIRKKLGAKAYYIERVPQKGYRFNSIPKPVP